MDAVVLKDIPFHIDVDQLMKKLRLRPGSDFRCDVERLGREAQELGRPKAMYKVAYLDSRGDDTVVIEGITFTSRVLSVNLEQAHRVFPFVATCGLELEEWANSIEDPLQRFWAETIKETVLQEARKALHHHLVETYRLGRTSVMSPGSLESWPIQQQRPLFALLGDTQTAIGVQLTPSLLMIPTKSVSGIRFPTEGTFESCQLCPRQGCPGRRAPYDSELYEKKYSH